MSDTIWDYAGFRQTAGLLPCPMCGKVATAWTKATYVPKRWTESGQENFVFVRLRVDKHRRCRFTCNLEKRWVMTDLEDLDDDVVNEILDKLQEKLYNYAKGEANESSEL